MARQVVKDAQDDYLKSIQNLVSGLDKIHPEIPLAYKEEKLLETLLNAMGISNESVELVRSMEGYNLPQAFKNYVNIVRSTKADYSIITSPTKAGNRKPILTKTSSAIEHDYNNIQIFQCNKKSINKLIEGCTGDLPQREDLFNLRVFTERLNKSGDFIRPLFDGSIIVGIGYRAKRRNIHIGSRQYKNVGMPPMLFLIHLKPVVATLDGEAKPSLVLKIQNVYSKCVSTTNTRFEEGVVLYDQPLANVDNSAHGHICLGDMRSSKYMYYKSIAHLDLFIDYMLECATASEDYGVHFAESLGIRSMDEYAQKFTDKDFPSETGLRPSRVSKELYEWYENVLNSLMGIRVRR